MSDQVADDRDAQFERWQAPERRTSSLLVLRFDPQRRAASTELRTAMEGLARLLIEAEKDRRIRTRERTHEERRRFLVAVEAIACNLLAATMVAPKCAVAVQRGSGGLFGRGRYGNPVYGRHFVAILNLMEQLGLIDATRGYRVSEHQRALSTITSTPAIAAHLPLQSTDWKALQRDESDEVILLKERKSKQDAAVLIDYRDTARTRTWRREVIALNRRLQAMNITALATMTPDGAPIDPTDRSLHRTFNNASWSEGGRLSPGFWTNMRRDERFRLLRINGEPIANVDFGQLYARLAYVRAGAPQPMGDLYDLGWPEVSRNAWKPLLNALFFADKPLGNWPRDSRPLFPKGMRLADAVRAIKVKHAPIAHLFERRIGFNLMFIESRLLLAALDVMARQGIDALPLHDSVLVARSRAEAARGIMQAEFERHTGTVGALVTIDSGEDFRHFA